MDRLPDRAWAPEPAGPIRGPLRRLAWVVIGLMCVGIGAVGIVLPGLPSTIFFIAAAASFSRSSPRLEAWLLNLPTIGPMVRDYRAGLGMPRRAKVVAIVMLTFFCGLSIAVVDVIAVRVIIAVAAVVGVAVILRLPTKPAEA